MIVAPRCGAAAFAKARAYSVPKTDDLANEDAWQRSHKGVGAVSDGASVSFDSAAWSRILVRRYARDPHFDRAWLASAASDFARLHDRENLPWMQQAAFDRGSFASLLGISHRDNGRVHVLGIGDSVALLYDGDHIVSSFPYESPGQFDERPRLLSTNPAENAFLPASGLDGISVEWDVAALERPALLCVTDALGCWMLSRRDDEPSPISILRGLHSRRAFARFVAAERAAQRMRRDDTTLLALWDW